MPNHVKKLSLTTDEKEYLAQLLRQSTLETRKYLRSRILLLKDEGLSNEKIADKLDVNVSYKKNDAHTNDKLDYAEFQEAFRAVQFAVGVVVFRAGHLAFPCANDVRFIVVIYADIVQDQGKFYYDEDKYYTNDTAFIISGDNLKYLVGVLNSKAFTFVYKNFYCGSSLGKKGLRFKRDFLLKVPIPFGNVKQIDEITALVDIIFKNKRSNHNFDSKQQEINIDFIAYQLYGLTYDEILIVDPETPITRDEYESK